MDDECRRPDAVKLLGAQVIELYKYGIGTSRPDNQILAGHDRLPCSKLVRMPDFRRANHRRQEASQFWRRIRLAPLELLLDVGLRHDEITRADAGEQIEHALGFTDL